MLTLLIKKELKETLGSSKFVYSFAVCSLLILITFYVGAKNYQVNKAQYDAAVAENIRSMKGITDWRMVNHNIFLPPQPLASLVAGISNDIGRNIEMKGRGELSPTDSKYNEDPIYAVFRFLDLTFLFQIILSLFAILFAYNAVNGEKENGTLRLIFSNALPRDRFILGKLLGTSLSLIIPLLIPMLLGCLLLIVLNIPMSGIDWLKLVLILFSGFLLFAIFINLSILFSTITLHPSNSFLILLVVWILSILVIPKASVMIAGRAVNVPSVDEINSKKNQYAQQLNKEHFEKLSGFNTSNTGDVMKEFQNFMEGLNEKRDDAMRSYSEKINGERNNKLNAQEDLAFAISRISPSASFAFASANLAGTSLDLVREYRNQASSYQKIFAKFQKDKTGSTTGGGMMFVIRNEGDNKPPEVNPGELPKFNFKAPDFSKSFSASLFDIALLLVFNFLFFGGSYMRFLKFDLR